MFYVWWLILSNRAFDSVSIVYSISFSLQLHNILPLHILFLRRSFSLNLNDVLHISHLLGQIEDFLLVLLDFVMMVDLLLLHFSEIGLFL